MADAIANLVWSPIESHLLDRCQDEGGVRLVVAPFIQREAFCHLMDGLSSHAETKVITRWNADDIASGASDPLVFEECCNRHIPLYVHSTIHLKLITMGSCLCLCSSANVTAAGLGLYSRGNVEAGAWMRLGAADWQHIYKIINDSRLVDQAAFDAATSYRERFLHSAPPLPPLELPPRPPMHLTLASLPATMSPEDVAAFAVADGDRTAGVADADVNRLMHDVVHFGVHGKADADSTLRRIGERFLQQAFVIQIINHVRERGSLRFGEMAAWIHEQCRDVPVPFRWEVKYATRVLYNWLTYFVPEISWSVPGQRSQVIRWDERSF